MAATLASFRNTFSEFKKTADGEIEAKLALAKLAVNAERWGAKHDFGVLYYAAHLVALAPAGQNAKLKPENAAKTVYWVTYREVLRTVTYGNRVAGQAPAGALTEPVG